MKPAAIDPPEIHSQLWAGFHGTVGWDIGANCGQSLPEMTTRFTQVVAFEPADECKPWLSAWMARPKVNLVVSDYAVTDVDGPVTLTALPDKIDTGQLVTAGTVGMEWNPDGPGAVPRVVTGRTVDSLVEELPAPDFLKIDVEGHEIRVLSGAWQTLTDYQPDLLIEFHSADLYDGIIECLHQHGYQRLDTVRHPHYPKGGPMWHTHGWVRAFYQLFG